MKREFGRLAFILLVLGVTGCDHATKQWMMARMIEGQANVIISGVLDIRYALNTDTAFGLLGAHLAPAPRLALLQVAAWLGVGLVSLFIALRWKQARGFERLAWALVLGGALGNAIDRLVHGYVTDFIHVHHWPVFNVADIAITVGVGLLVGSRYVGVGWPSASPRNH
jgi:signal peptidase II